MNQLPTNLTELEEFIDKATEGQSKVPMTAHVDGYIINEVRWYRPEGGDPILELREDKCSQFDAISMEVSGDGDDTSIIVTNPDGVKREVYFMPVSRPLTLAQVIDSLKA